MSGIRIFNAMEEQVTTDLESNHHHIGPITIQAFSNSEYLSGEGARYSLKVNSRDKNLLHKEYGFAGSEKYSVILFGKPEFSSKPNESSFSHKLHYVFAGAENYTANGFLPSVMVFRDNIKLKKDFSAVRAFHAAPGITPITIKIKGDQKTLKLASKLSYAKPVMSKRLKSGEKNIELYLANSSDPILIKSYYFKSKRSYVIIVISDQKKIDFKIIESPN